jgi:hypothetical protein
MTGAHSTPSRRHIHTEETTMPGNPAMDSSPALKVDDEQFTPTREPETHRNRATGRPVIAPKLHHTTFTTKRLNEMVAWKVIQAIR